MKLLSYPVKIRYERLAADGKVDPLPVHSPFMGVYFKLAPTIFGPHEFEAEPRFAESFQQLFNIYTTESLVATMVEAVTESLISPPEDEIQLFISELANLMLPESERVEDLQSLALSLRKERKKSARYA